MNYYNEIDAGKAEWIRELIRRNVVSPGDVDERSIADVDSASLRGYAQCHFFAGIGVWSYALRLAGWADDRPVWTGSCPCPSFSAAGKGGGFNDPRHLWPAWSRLIGECQPATIFGEQADDAIGYGWLDLVQTDLERAHYAVGKAVLGAASVGAPHIRQRLYFVAHADATRERERLAGPGLDGGDDGAIVGSSHPTSARRTETGQHDGGSPLLAARSVERGRPRLGPDSHGRQPSDGDLQRSGEQRLLAQDGGTGERSDTGDVRNWRGPGWLDPHTARSVAAAGATRGFWRDCDWWHARDGKYRPIEPGLFPLAHGAANRVLKLRGYGDAINAEVAKAFIESYVEATKGIRELTA